MLRVTGMLFVIAGCSGLGFYYRGELYRGLWCMRTLRQMLEMMMSEIHYNKSTLPECCKRVGNRMEVPFSEALLGIYEKVSAQSGDGFTECWKEGMQKCLAGMPISGQEAEMVLGFASCGGLNDCQMQIRAIEQYRDMVDGAVKRREEVLHQQGRMAAGLGIMSGLLLAVILL